MNVSVSGSIRDVQSCLLIAICRLSHGKDAFKLDNTLSTPNEAALSYNYKAPYDRAEQR